MVSVALCDDEKIQRSILKDMLLKICKKNNMVIVIDEFSSGEELLELYNNGIKKYSIIFCDIMMDKLNGIELLKNIREIDTSLEAILVSGSDEYIFDGYDVGALNYLMKPVCYEKLEREFLRAMEKMNSVNHSIYPVSINGRTHLLNLSEISFFEVNNKTITCNYKSDVINFNMKIRDLEEDLKDRNFMRCHRSYLINLSKVKEILQNEVVLQNSHIIPLGRSYKKDLKSYILNKLREA